MGLLRTIGIEFLVGLMTRFVASVAGAVAILALAPPVLGAKKST